VVVNFGQDPVALPEGEVLVSSHDLVGGLLPADSAAWVADTR
jgi:alpha-glucosidase